jgi:hypothetical protein
MLTSRDESSQSANRDDKFRFPVRGRDFTPKSNVLGGAKVGEESAQTQTKSAGSREYCFGIIAALPVNSGSHEWTLD